MQNGLRTDAIYGLPPSSPVLVWKEGNISQSSYWDGPHMLLAINGETCTIKLLNRPTTFRSTVVKPYLLDLQDPVEPQEPVELAKLVPSPAKPQLLPKAKPQLLLK